MPARAAVSRRAAFGSTSQTSPAPAWTSTSAAASPIAPPPSTAQRDAGSGRPSSRAP
jgi:hypothetical protein